jgi:methionine sulfoxide reductase heme-binding subunit
MIALLAAQNTKAYWYLTRGSGAVATILLSLSMVLGVMTSMGVTTRQIPRFLVQGLHRNVSLLVVVFVVLHVATTVIDGFVKIGWIDAIVPFRSGYHAWWVGLGTLSLDLLLAVVATSVLRVHISYSTWRLVHWASYASWPIAMWHGFELGSDRHAPWMLWVNVVCLVAVVGAIFARLWTGGGVTDPRLPAYRRPVRR